ncbi:MAG: HAMP domain-containing histidine kinase [Lachnospiraceae bacterium]|nr:HAMP domain-containing histidine kinase [Lachnospiraceae bacterium]
MNRGRKRGLFWIYLQQYWGTILLFFLFGGIFALVFFLYKLEAEAVFYAMALCGLLALPMVTVNFCTWRKAHEERRRILKHSNLAEELPRPGTLLEADYQDMVRSLQESLDASLLEGQRKRQESMDYYTTWVHQIKTPIAAMRMLLQSEDTREHRALEAELFRIEQYVELVLSYMRLDEEASDFVFREYELDTIIRRAIHKYAAQFVGKRIRLVYEPVSVKVVTDEKWLQLLIEQLLSNAVKYTQKGSVTITVTQKQVLRIQDTGIGIAPEDIPRIFEKGFTGYNGRTETRSTGLGLYLCRRTAKKLSNKIWAESCLGEGSSFFVDLHREQLEVE